jgi:hypothetical protein
MGGWGTRIAAGSAMRNQLLALLVFSMVPATAAADVFVEDVGLRIGGYGFRETNNGTENSDTGWQACRMNGIGVYATHSLNKNFYLEGGLDTYFAGEFPTGEARGNYDTPIDRVSALLTVAVGARLWPDAVFSPYMQLGAGGEFTRARLPELGLEDKAILPMGFFGVGASIRAGDRLKLGAAFRVNAMGYYDDDQFQMEMSPTAELATQGQFFASYAL